ncbi:permease-like cell division protein FtsX [Arsenicicoccus dermatophilus]|uniref:permease-like cell division protein FtsX n=1 Tax=Arsenicicoccus dermatophilus TaxID=1076331 RepID=UPI001F4C6BC7|nr:permease-like cell division protein FtsX [Arsenicicoccus dermatophilus]MCH8613547.1 permease-like cell division protein FtsX [Arsenicicoccus dermatophilus]
MRAGFILREAMTGLRRNLSMAVSVALVTMVSLLFLGIGMLSYHQVQTMKGYWYDKIQVSVVLCNATSGEAACSRGAATAADRAAVERQLKAMPVVQSWHYESQQEAYQNFQQQFRDNPIVAGTRPEQLKASYRIRLTDPQEYPQLTSTFQGSPGVEKVEDQRKVVEPLIDLLSSLTLATMSLAAVMLLCAVLLVATTVRSSAYTRRRETGIMRLVGAGSMTIRAPFVIETVVAALSGAALAIGLLAGLLGWLSSRQAGQSVVFGGVALVGPGDLWRVAPWLVLVAVLVALVTSWSALRRHLRV